MNQYDSPHCERTLCAWPQFRRVAYLLARAFYALLVVSACLSPLPAMAQTLPLQSLNEAAITRQILPCVTRAEKHHHRYLFRLFGPWHHKARPDPACQRIVRHALALPPPPQPEWLLIAGHPAGQQLIQWGQEVGWHVIWRSQQDWLVPNNTVFHGSFTDVASRILQDLAAQGAPIHGIFYQGNQTLVVTGATP